MPRGDGTGPIGAGPMTGHGAGYCVAYVAQGFATPTPGRGLQSGLRGGGHGWRNRFYATGLPGWMRAGYAPPSPEQEVTALKDESVWLKDQLDAINQRIEELEHK